jgi:hypothetical protein
MKNLRTLFRAAGFACLVLAGWAASFATALADRGFPEPEQVSGSNDYALAYFLVAFPILLGLLIVLRASNRRTRDKPAQYVEKNLLRNAD